ncbi:major facilitator superfamily domain-containing protein [Aspergillus minisclerotigenes]|uniref:Major facilitator superfamily domain-containing protein n=1 Tax=Aspergillus minisclerotigenes TaxID=656917 RepID=A0A5N6JA00_9EURO|nr:major facilitator superfamily domain-containing protein [Aspergillus minisclerotigenes]
MFNKRYGWQSERSQAHRLEDCDGHHWIGNGIRGFPSPALVFAAITPLVSASFNASSLLIWFFTTHIVSCGVISPFAGPLADMFGRKRITLAGIASSMIAMIVCASTPTAGGYIAGQVLAGVGIAVQELMAIAAITEIVPIKYRGYYTAMVVAAFLPFAPASLYGKLISRTNWRYCACMIAVWNFLTFIIVFLFYRPPPRPNSANLTWFQKVKRIDFLGGFLMACGTVLFLVGFNWGGQAYPWHSPRVIAFLTIGLASGVLFFLYEIFLAPHPMFPRRLLQHPRTFTALMLVILFSGINYVSILVFWVLEAVGVYNSDETELGIRTLPFGFCILGGAIISALMVSAFTMDHELLLHNPSYRILTIQSTAISCMVAVDTHNINTVWASLVLSLIAVGGVLIPNQLIMTVICPDDLIATGTCLTVCLRRIGQVIGTSIFYTQFVSVLTHNTYEYVVPVAIETGITDFDVLETMETPWKEWALSVSALNTAEKLNMLHDAVINAFAPAFARVWNISIAFGVAAVIASGFMEDLTNLMDEHIAANYF